MKPNTAHPPLSTKEALEHVHKNGDTLDVFASRIRRTTSKARHGVIWGPTAFLEMFANGLPALEYVVTAPVYMVGLTAVSGLVYGGQRYREKGKVQKAEIAQQVIRDETNEPVDVLRTGRRKDRELVLWWRGADDPKAQNVRHRYGALVEYAQDKGLDRVMVSADVLKGLPANDLEKYGNVIESKDFFKGKQGKRVNVKDRKGPDELLSSTLAEAKLLLEALRKEEAKDPFIRIANRLSITAPEHKFREHFDAWKNHNRDPLLKNKIIDELRRSLEARHTARMDMVAGTRTNRLEVRTQSVLTTKGLERVTSATDADSGKQVFQNSNIIPSRTLLDEKDPSRFILDISKRPMKQFCPDDAETCEYALYLLLTNQVDVEWVKNELKHLQNEDGEEGVATGVAGVRSTSDTFLQRLKNESPRTALLTRKYGKKGNSVEYGKHIVKPRVHKLAAAVLAIGLGGGLGYLAGEWNMYFYNSGPTCSDEERARFYEEDSKDMQCVKDRKHYLDTHPYLNAADVVYEFHGGIEDGILLDLYKSKILDFKTLSTVDDYLSRDWIQKKKDELADLASLVHIQGGAPIGVSADPTKEGASNPPMWTIENHSNQSAEGYWYEGIYSELAVERNLADDILPYTDVGLIARDVYRFEINKNREIGISYDNGNTFSSVRNVPLKPMDEIGISNEVMIISGKQDTAIEWSFANPSINDTAGKSVSLLTMPVLENADVVGAKVVVRDYAENRILHEYDTKVIQLPDGSFKLVVSGDNKLETVGYYDITFAIKPNAGTALPTRAVLPVTINAEKNGWPAPITGVISEADVANIRAKLKVGPDASAEEIAEAFKAQYGYTYAPYDGKEGTEKGKDVPAQKAAVKIVESAVEEEDVNCTIPAASTIVAERGEDRGRKLAYAAGSRQDASGKEKVSYLERAKAHAWVVTSEGTKIDGTPQATNPQQSKPKTTEAKQEAPDTTIDRIKEVGSVVVGVSLSIPGFVGGKNTLPPILAYRRRRRDDYTRGYITRELTFHPTRLQDDITVLEHLLYSPGEGRLDAENLPVKLLADDTPATIERRINSLPQISKQALAEVIEMRDSNGKLTITPASMKRLQNIIDAKALKA